MNRKILSTAVLVLVTAFSIPLAQAGRGDDDHPRSVYREKYVEKHYYHPGKAYGHRHRHEHHRYQHHYYQSAPPRYNYDDYDRYPARHAQSPAPIILGSVIGGVVGHEIGHGDPGHTAVGAVIGTIIGYDIARHRR